MVLIICKIFFLLGNIQVHLQFYCISKLQLRQKDQVEMQIDSSSTSNEISFHGLPSKSKCLSIRKQIALPLSLQLIVSLFLQYSHLQRDIQQTCFCQYFCKFLENSCSTSKNSFENFQKVHKKHPWQSLSKVFYRSSHQSCLKKKCSQKGVCRIHRKRPVSGTLF